MSNYGLNNFFKTENIKFLRSNVGDRYVKETMHKNKFNLGGEQSGHIILGKFATTGDGLLVALEVLFSLRKGYKASKVLRVFKPIPQKLVNIAVKDKSVINKNSVKKAIINANKMIKNKGRVLVRPSGTEPKVRIMVETLDKNLMQKCLRLLTKAIK